MSGVGTDIWNTQDEFRFVYKPLTGDGSVIARVDSIENTDVWAKAGVMIRESLDDTSKYAMVMVTAASGVSFQQRISPGGASTSVTQAGLEAPYWVKLTRAGNTFTAQRSADGVTWEAITADAAASSATISMIGNVYVGLAVTSHNAAAAATAMFSNVATTGSESGQWQSAEIGVAQPSNTPDKLYVAVRDGSGHTAVAVHPDPAATLIDTWQQWLIPLSEFSAGGVVLNRIETLVIGVGDPAGQGGGGKGMVFIDDISVGHPLAAEPMSTEIETFDVSRDFLSEGAEGTFWDGFLGLGDNETVDALNASIDRAGQLYIQSTGAFFHEPWSPIGPFLYKVVEGNFVATVKVAEYAGTAEAPVYHNTCGLMARALPDEAGPGEDWVSLDYFPIWSCGNFVRSANDDVRTENGHNGKAFASDRHLQIERIGNVFHFRTSPDGVAWTAMAVSPLTRDDLDGVALQVGLFQATYSSDPGYAAFDDFILETPK
jgi:regulation of enolase protein 1 (concanavalin A-like superfamily)